MVTAAKTVSQIGMHMSVAFGVMYVMTGSVAAGGVAAVLEPVINVILMPLHDKFWERIRSRFDARAAEPGSGDAKAAPQAGSAMLAA